MSVQVQPGDIFDLVYAVPVGELKEQCNHIIGEMTHHIGHVRQMSMYEICMCYVGVLSTLQMLEDVDRADGMVKELQARRQDKKKEVVA